MLKKTKAGQQQPIAVVGIGSLYPGAHDIQSYWQTISEGRDQMQQVPGNYWLSEDFFNPEFGTADRTYTDRGAFIDAVDLDVFDSGVTPNNLSTTDVSQLLAVHVAKQVMKDAGFLYDESLKENTSVILGMSGATEMMSAMSGRLGEPVWRHALRESGLPDAQVDELVHRMLDYFPAWKETTFPGLLGNVIAGRIANRLDLHGTNCVVDAACASSFSALSMAINELNLYQSDLVLTGGVDALNHPLMYMCFAQTGALSRTGDCRPFSDQADGTMMGEGVGMLALRRLADAERDGDAIYAVIRACGSSSDGSSKSVYAPVAEGQAIALQRTYDIAGYKPSTVELMEAHGTATVAGDAAEVAGLKSVFESDAGRKQWCALGSVKSQIGHTKGAAGAAGLIKSILALQQKVLPPTIKVERPNPKLDIDNSPFYINTQTRPWVRDAHHPRRASASALGFGGTNFHVTVEEYIGPGQRPARLQLSPIEAVLINGDSIDDVVARCRQLHNIDMQKGSLRYLAYSTQHEAKLSQQIKLVLLAKDEADLLTQLDKAITLLNQQPLSNEFEINDGNVFISCGVQSDKTALLFPGQGSQYLGMGSDLAMFLPEAQAVWDRAATALVDQSPHHAVFPPPAMTELQQQTQEQLLRRVEQAQPALGVCALANWHVLNKLGVTTDALAGHSFGEVVALHVAGVFDETELFDIALTRGNLMSAAAADHEGAMSAVIGNKQMVKQVVETAEDDLVIANDNSPTQSVISGSLESITQAEQQLKAKGLQVIRLPVASAFHSSIVASASEPFLKHLKKITFHKPHTPVIACSTAKPYAITPAAMHKTLATQLAKPVRFVEQIEQLYASGIRNFIEVGAGNVLSKLVAECLHSKPHRVIACDKKSEHGVISLYKALAHLTIAGININWPALWDDVVIPKDTTNKKKPKLSRAVAGSNLERPYPPTAGAAKLHTPMDYFSKPQQQPLQQEVSMNKNETLPENTVNTQQQTISSPPANPPQAGVHQVLLAAQQQYQASMQAMQQSMTDAHLNYLQAVQSMLGNTTESVQTSTQPAVPVPTFTPPQPAMVPTPAPTQNQVIAETATAVTQPAVDIKTPKITVSTSTATNTHNIVELFLDVVADKTGYPREVLELDMEMESGLGIDSIKRVEILAELQKQLPELAELDATQLATLSTLREVVDSVEQTANAGQIVVQAIEHAKQPEKKTLNETQHRHVIRNEKRATPGFVTTGLFNQGTIAITGVNTDVATELQALLSKIGLRAEQFRTLDNLPDKLTGLICLQGLHDVDNAKAGIDQQIEVVKILQQAAGSLQTNKGFLILAQSNNRTTPPTPSTPSTPSTPWNRGLVALARTAKLEWPTVTTRFISCDQTSQQLAQTLLDELLSGGDNLEVTLQANGDRSQTDDKAQQIKPDSMPLTDDAVVVVAGGGRGVTAACVIELATQQRLRFALLGRSKLVDEPVACRDANDETALIKILSQGKDKPDLLQLRQQAKAILASREIHHTLKMIQAAGSEAQYFCTDILDKNEVEQTLQRVRQQWGAIHGLIHAAGVLADKRIIDKTEQQLTQVMRTKLQGIEVLLQATQADPLQLIVLFSSVAARYGNVGQCDYAMANEVLNQLALSLAQQRPECRVKSLMWGPWDGGMVTPALKKHFTDMQVPLIDLKQGSKWFVDELKQEDEILVVLGEGRELSKTESVRTEVMEFAVLVSAQQQPYLIDHTINGKVVLPVVQIIEWFMRATKNIEPDQPSIIIEDLQVLSGIKLSNFTEQQLQLHIRLKQMTPQRYEATLFDEHNKPCYRAFVVLDAQAEEPIDKFAKPEKALTPWPIDIHEAYGEEGLFHGPAFQVIHELGTMGDDGCVLQISADTDRQWRGAPFLSHPALIDGCLQMLVLWGQCKNKQHSLPVSIKRVQWFRQNTIQGVVRCFANIRTQENLLESNMLVVDAQNRPLLALEGVNNIIYSIKSEAL